MLDTCHLLQKLPENTRWDFFFGLYLEKVNCLHQGNTAMHMPQAPGLKIPHMLGALPGMTEFATRMMRSQIGDLDVPTIPEMLDQISAAGGHLWGCRMTFDMLGLTMADLYDEVEDVISANDFIEISEGAQIIFI